MNKKTMILQYAGIKIFKTKKSILDAFHKGALFIQRGNGWWRYLSTYILEPDTKVILKYGKNKKVETRVKKKPNPTTWAARSWK